MGVPVTESLLRGVAVPNFGDEPAGLIELGVAAEQAGFDGFFLWDHIVFSNSGDGPPIIDPWLVLAVVAARTSRIKLGTMITPVPRRRPWQLARQIASLDRLSGGRVILGVGIGSPAYGDHGIFHEPTGDRVRADMLDEGLAVLAGLWSGERFSYAGEHYTVDPVRFTPVPVQRPRVPIWVGGVLPNRAADRPGGALGRSRPHPVRGAVADPAVGAGHRRRAGIGGHRARHGGRLRRRGLGRGGTRSRGGARPGSAVPGGGCDLVDRDRQARAALVGRDHRAGGRRGAGGSVTFPPLP